MQFHTILTSIALLGGLILPAFDLAHAQSLPAANLKTDEVILDMSQAFNKLDRKRLSALLPQVRGHTLEAWGAYWELRARLDTATPKEITEFLTRFAGTYQEDRLRNDWLLMLGQRREWGTFAAEQANYRMNDDREVRCYGYAAEFILAGVDLSGDIKRQWYAQKDSDDGCTFAAATLYGAKKLTEADIWRKARLAVEANRPRAAKTAAEIISNAAAANIDPLISNPARYLGKRVVANGNTAKESVVLALIRLAQTDPDTAASMLENHWSVHLNAEQRSWTWGAIGKVAAQRLSSDASAIFANAKDSDLNDDQLGWKVRAALRQS